MLVAENRVRALLGGLATLCFAPFLFARIPEMVDAPNHIARIHILTDHAHNPAFAIHWRWIGNLGVDLPAIFLTPLLGVEGAVGLIVALTAPLTIFGLYRLSMAAHGRFTGMAAMALPLILAQTFGWGFLNYNVSIALALIVAASWLHRPPEGWCRALLFGAGGLMVWTAHAMGWGVLLLIISGVELARCGRDWRQLPGRLLVALPLLIPLVPMALWRAPGSADFYHYDAGLLAEKIMNYGTVLRGTSKPVDLAMTVIIFLVANMVLLKARRFEPRLGIAGGLLTMATLLAPTTMMGSWAADLRMVPIAAIIVLSAIPTAPGSRLDNGLMIGGITLLLVRIALLSATWQAADVLHQPQLALLDKVPRGSRIGYGAIASRCWEPTWQLRSERHLGSYAITRRDAFTNTTFLVRGADLVTVANPIDAVQWTDGSQELILVDCPSGKPAPARVASQLAAMAHAFDMIWIVSADGTPVASLPPVAGMRVIGSVPGSILLAHRPST